LGLILEVRPLGVTRALEVEGFLASSALTL
jgi:hypothetical protein